MNDEKRGKIQHIKRAQQINNFENMRYGKITPTDIDGCIEYKNKAIVYFEIKYKDKELPLGQKIALQVLVSDVPKNKQAIAIVCEHYIDDVDEQIDVANCIVRELYLSTERKWRPPSKPMKLKELTDLFIYNIVDGVEIVEEEQIELPWEE